LRIEQIRLIRDSLIIRDSVRFVVRSIRDDNQRALAANNALGMPTPAM
jgi:hypothetical protein